MNKKGAASAAAVIEIGTSQVSMRVAQLSKGEPVTLDILEYPIRLGRDVFETGSISFESLRELSSVLEKFSSALLAYNVQKPKVISCAAFREAKNRALAADQLRVRNGLEVTVLEDGQENSYVYQEILHKLDGAKFLQNNDCAIVHVSSGSISVAVYDGARIVYFQNIPRGVWQLYDTLQDMRSTTEDPHTVMEEYLDTLLNHIILSRFSIKHLVITGSQIDLVAKLCGAKSAGRAYEIDAGQISDLYRSIRSLTPESVSLRYGIPENRAAVLLAALSIYHAVLRFCPEAKSVHSPAADISEAVLRCALSPKADAQRVLRTRENAIACAETMALGFGCDPAHSQYIRDCACSIFDKLKKIHGLDDSKRLILELAAILHSCGSFVSVRHHNRCTYDIIRGMDLFGLSRTEVLEAAFTAGSASDGPSEGDDPEFARLTRKEQLVVSKLSAIFRMANALDKSHRRKLRDLKITVENDRVLFKAAAPGDVRLEQWAFEESAGYFKDVFGLSPELSVKFELI